MYINTADIYKKKNNISGSVFTSIKDINGFSVETISRKKSFLDSMRKNHILIY